MKRLKRMSTIDREQTEIQATLDDIAKIVLDFEGTTSDSAYKRASGRLVHVILRIKRLRLDPSDPKYTDIETFKNESYATALKIEADLEEKVTQEDDTAHNSTTIDPRLLNQNLNTQIFFKLKGHGSILIIYGNNDLNLINSLINFKKLTFIYLKIENNIFSYLKIKKMLNSNSFPLNNLIIQPFLNFIYYLRKI